MVSFKKSLIIGAVLCLFGLSQAQEKCQICLHGTPAAPGGTSGLCFMAKVGTVEEQAPFQGYDEGMENAISSFNAADGGWCQDCVLTAYSSRDFGGRSQVLDFGENYEFGVDFCAKSYRLVCTKVRYDPPTIRNEVREGDEEGNGEGNEEGDQEGDQEGNEEWNEEGNEEGGEEEQQGDDQQE